MLSMGYRQSQGDHTLSIQHSAIRGVTILIVYVDEIVVTDKNNKGMAQLKECLLKEFEINDLGRLNISWE